MRALLVPLGLLVAGCTAPTEPVEWRDAGCRSTATEEATWTAGDPEGLARAWSTSCEGEPPVVDFGREQVVAYFWGAKPDSGHQVRLDAVVEGPPHQVRVVRVTPGDHCGTLAVVTHSGFVAVVPLMGPVRFFVADHVNECGAS